MKKLYAAAITVALMVVCNPANAQDMFLKVIGFNGLYLGDVTDPKHANQMEGLAWSNGLSTAIANTTGCRSCGKAQLQTFNVTVYACPGIIQAKMDQILGKVLTSVDFYVRKRNSVYYIQKIHMEEVIISRYK